MIARPVCVSAFLIARAKNVVTMDVEEHAGSALCRSTNAWMDFARAVQSARVSNAATMVVQAHAASAATVSSAMPAFANR